jgi:pimeloyl-ACP methyl ester carboxylesterase
MSYRGTGESKRPDAELDLPSHHSIPFLAADVLALLRSGEVIEDLIPSHKLVIVAHSMSAKVAWEVLCGLSPTRSEATPEIEVVSVLLIAPAPPGPLELPPEMRQQQLIAYQTVESAKWTIANVLTHRPLSQEVIDRSAKDCAGMSPGAKRGWIEEGMKYSCVEAVRNLAATHQGQSAKLVRVLVGTEDVVETVGRVQSETVDLLQSLGGFAVNMRVLEGCGHLVPLEDPDSVVEEVGKLLLVR